MKNARQLTMFEQDPPDQHGYRALRTPPPDVCRTHHKGDAESEAANDSIHPFKNTLRQKVFAYLVAVGGATCDEVEAALELRHQTASARLTELVQMERATRSDETRPTRSGRNARVVKAARQVPGGRQPDEG
jgi:hypothetical protein